MKVELAVGMPAKLSFQCYHLADGLLVMLVWPGSWDL